MFQIISPGIFPYILGFYISLIVVQFLFGFWILGLYLVRMRKTQDAAPYFLATSLYFLCLGAGRIIYAWFDFSLTGFDPTTYTTYAGVWKLATAITTTGLAFFVYQLEKNPLQNKTKGIMTAFTIGFIVLTVAYPVPVGDVAAAGVIQYFAFGATAFALVAPFIYFFLATKIPNYKLTGTIVGMGMLIYFTGEVVLANVATTVLATIGFDRSLVYTAAFVFQVAGQALVGPAFVRELRSAKINEFDQTWSEGGEPDQAINWQVEHRATSSEVWILKESMPVFHRSYGEKNLENFELIAGFLKAVLQFWSHEVQQDLEALKMSDFLFYFSVQGEFTFILREDRKSPRMKEQVTLILESLAERFFHEFPNATKWKGNLTDFDGFTMSCDEVLQASPARKGFPMLLKVALKPFSLTPVLQMTPIPSENEESLEELKSQLNQVVKQGGTKRIKTFLMRPCLLYLPSAQQVVYIYSFSQDPNSKDLAYLLCFVAREQDWFTLYQVITLVRKKAQYIIPQLIGYLQQLEENSAPDEIRQMNSKNKGILDDWADLNQYISRVQTSLFEKFFESGITSDNLTETEIRNHLSNLFELFGDNFSKIFFALLSLRQILFIGNDRMLVEQTLSAILAFYPHPAAILWVEEPSDSLLVGTSPSFTGFYPKSTVIVDLSNQTILGGDKNDFCSTLMQETVKLAQEASVPEARLFFQQRVSSLFSFLKEMLRTLTLAEKDQSKRLEEILKSFPVATIQLLAKMSENFNFNLASNLHAWQMAKHLGI
ncbi:MAG TPA: hypothetical protein VKK79_22325 [Candidatus Lokiarchaeia archaeon]|nr:hypothetical protein [Candidatus Lokiarchaeia archaeon]